ncbi:MAG: 2Fe-2S iron-sulfur cluster binding domain-containing protein [Methylococcaceae bacterium]|nr:2Fe-2S iron-sulfur cluster binding domain-containing protein [Methylococcaceae bacterium]
MTSLSLLLWIGSGILLQLAIYLGFVIRNQWLNYRTLPSNREALTKTGKQDKLGVSEDLAVPAWLGFRTFRVDRKVIEDANRSICSFYLVAKDGQPLPAFLPGQFLIFCLDVPTPTGINQQLIRCYSLSDAPRPDCYRVSIKQTPSPPGIKVPPGSSSHYFHKQVDVGSLLQVRAPSGHFHLDRTDIPVVLIGGGIGITPMLSMLNWCLSNQTGREVWLFYGVRNSREVVQKPHLEALAVLHKNFHLWLCFSAPLPEDLAGCDYHYQGRIDVNLLRSHLPSKAYQFYICGPTPMLESLVPALEEWGVSDTHIHFEAFGPASIKRKIAKDAMADSPNDPVAKDILVNFANSDKQLQWQASANSLLDFAEAHGITVISGCRAGSCGSCQTNVLSGEVVYLNPPDYDPEPGTCLLCVCSPKTNLTLEA